MREVVQHSTKPAVGATSTNRASSSDDERILLLECRLVQLRSALEEARAEADRMRMLLADSAAREAELARRFSAIHGELAEARAEIASLHERLNRSEALRAEYEGYLFEAGARGDAAELVHLRREVLALRQTALLHERTASRLRTRVDELLASRDALLTRIAEWQRLVWNNAPEAVDLAAFIAELRSDILQLEDRNLAGERLEAALRERLVRAGVDPDAPLDAQPSRPTARRVSESDGRHLRVESNGDAAGRRLGAEATGLEAADAGASVDRKSGGVAAAAALSVESPAVEHQLSAAEQMTAVAAQTGVGADDDQFAQSSSGIVLTTRWDGPVGADRGEGEEVRDAHERAASTAEAPAAVETLEEATAQADFADDTVAGDTRSTTSAQDEIVRAALDAAEGLALEEDEGIALDGPDAVEAVEAAGVAAEEAVTAANGDDPESIVGDDPDAEALAEDAASVALAEDLATDVASTGEVAGTEDDAIDGVALTADSEVTDEQETIIATVEPELAVVDGDEEVAAIASAPELAAISEDLETGVADAPEAVAAAVDTEVATGEDGSEPRAITEDAEAVAAAGDSDPAAVLGDVEPVVLGADAEQLAVADEVDAVASPEASVLEEAGEPLAVVGDTAAVSEHFDGADASDSGKPVAEASAAEVKHAVEDGEAPQASYDDTAEDSEVADAEADAISVESVAQAAADALDLAGAFAEAVDGDAAVEGSDLGETAAKASDPTSAVSDPVVAAAAVADEAEALAQSADDEEVSAAPDVVDAAESVEEAGESQNLPTPAEVVADGSAARASGSADVEVASEAGAPESSGSAVEIADHSSFAPNGLHEPAPIDLFDDDSSISRLDGDAPAAEPADERELELRNQPAATNGVTVEVALADPADAAGAVVKDMAADRAAEAASDVTADQPATVEAATEPRPPAPVEGLDSTDPGTRAAAYERLVRVLRAEPDRLEEYLREGLADPHPRVRRRVALSIGTARELPIQSLLEPLRADPDPQIRQIVREMLRNLNGSRPISAGSFRAFDRAGRA